MSIYKFTLDRPQLFEFTLADNYIIDGAQYHIYFKDKIMGSIKTISSNYTSFATLEITIYDGYSWDGCSPKLKLGTSIIGVWDGFTDVGTQKPKAYYASLIHDFLLQFQSQLSAQITTRLIHQIFYKILQQYNFPLAYPYYLAVRFWSFLKHSYKLVTGRL